MRNAKQPSRALRAIRVTIGFGTPLTGPSWAMQVESVPSATGSVRKKMQSGKKVGVGGRWPVKAGHGQSRAAGQGRCWPLFIKSRGRCLAGVAKSLAGVWPGFGRCLAGVWPVFGRCLAGVWLAKPVKAGQSRSKPVKAGLRPALTGFDRPSEKRSFTGFCSLEFSRASNTGFDRL